MVQDARPMTDLCATARENGWMRWIDGLEQQAQTKLPAPVFEYFRRGTGREYTLLEASPAWDRLRLRPRVLRDVSTVDTATSVLGTPVATPLLVAPLTLQMQCDPAGELATAAGVSSAGSLLAVSSNTGIRYEALAGPGAPWWVQAYLLADRDLTANMLARAVHGGARAVVLTVDAPAAGQGDPAGGPRPWSAVPAEHLRANWNLKSGARATVAADVSFDDIGWLREITGLPVVVKGLLRGDDARQAVKAGAGAVLVSNHGGRQLDGLMSTAQALPEIVDALAGTGAEVYVDGGIRRGEHALAALALGATAVFVGRPVLWALATAGADGVHRLLTELTAELAAALTLCGTPTLTELDASLITSK